jgi:hypothetical protein
VATTSETALLAATAVHAGFQLTVTALVYPALFRAPDWQAAHTAHRRSITPVVALVYAALVAAAVLALVDGPSGPCTVVALGGVALALGTTALVAAPLHGRLSPGRDEGLVRRLRVADLVRTVAAFAALAGAVVAAL